MLKNYEKFRRLKLLTLKNLRDQGISRFKLIDTWHVLWQDTAERPAKKKKTNMRGEESEEYDRQGVRDIKAFHTTCLKGLGTHELYEFEAGYDERL